MAPIEAAGAGRTLRADRLTAALIRQTAETLLRSGTATSAAKKLMPLVEAAEGVGAAFDTAAARLLTTRC